MNESLLEININLLLWGINIGPLLSINQISQGGTHFTAKLEKDTFDPSTFDRTQASVYRDNMFVSQAQLSKEGGMGGANLYPGQREKQPAPARQ